MKQLLSPYGNEHRISLAKELPPAKIQILNDVLNGLSFDLLSCSCWQNHTPWFVPPRRIADHFCVFPLEGTMSVILPNSSHRLRRGEALLLPIQMEHSFGLSKEEKRVRHLIFHTLVQKSCLFDPFSALSSPIQKIRDAEFYLPRLNDAVVFHDAGKKEGLDYAANLLKMLFTDLARQNRLTLPDSFPNPRIRAGMEFAMRNFQTNIAVADMAAASRLKEVRFRTLFRQSCGIPPSRYLFECRIRHAVKLLSDSARTISDIAQESGFGSECYFCYVWKRHTGQTPGEYRKHLLRIS